ncbi:MAG: hypothetical protein Q3971_07750 [Moraxella sp.]|nr:hypothetical protein [Moraxella sp.]
MMRKSQSLVVFDDYHSFAKSVSSHQNRHNAPICPPVFLIRWHLGQPAPAREVHHLLANQRIKAGFGFDDLIGKEFKGLGDVKP